MERSALLRLIQDHRPADAKEAADRETILAFLKGPGDFFDRRRFDPGHLTGSAFILDAAGRHLLLVHHAKLGRWLQPGGHGEPGETDPFAVARREAEEETGIAGLVPLPAGGGPPTPFDLDVHLIPTRGDEPVHRHLDIRYLFAAPDGADPRVNAESRAARWVPLPVLAAASDTDPSVVRAARKIQAAFRRQRA